MPELPKLLSAAMTERVDGDARRHLLREDGQEDLCFGIWYPSHGAKRTTALLQRLVLPTKGDREVHGNASFEPAFFERAIKEAARAGGGIAFMHSHPGPGWQPLSPDDYEAEGGHAGAAIAATGLPLLGLTIGNDGSWSARIWNRTQPKTYEPQWCASVRVVGKGLVPHFHPRLVGPYRLGPQLLRTVSFWGEASQARLARLRVGIVGLGSVGSIVAEALARTGLGWLSLLDYDRVKPHNLDRTHGATTMDAKSGALKVAVAARTATASATASAFEVQVVPLSVCEPDGYRAALDCDLLFSCVDRPWARRVLNHIAYAHLIPVIDGGITVRMPKGRFKNANWSVRTVGPHRACLECVGAYDSGLVQSERDGHLDDPHYLEQLPADSPLKRNENIYALSMSLAAAEVLQFVALMTGLVQMREIGEQRYSYFPGIVDVQSKSCDEHCLFQPLLSLGESADERVGQFIGIDPAASKERTPVRHGATRSARRRKS